MFVSINKIKLCYKEEEEIKITSQSKIKVKKASPSESNLATGSSCFLLCVIVFFHVVSSTGSSYHVCPRPAGWLWASSLTVPGCDYKSTARRGKDKNSGESLQHRKGLKLPMQLSLSSSSSLSPSLSSSSSSSSLPNTTGYLLPPGLEMYS